MKAKDEGVFFYRNKQFQENGKAVWGADLFVENTQTPEKFQSFWDNIHAIKSTLGREGYAQQQCEILKNIKIENMEVEFRDGEGLYIRDKTDKDIFAVLDYRDSTNGELRGKNLANVLQEYVKKEYIKTPKSGSVYDALNNVLRSHNNPTFAGGAIRLGVEEWARSIVFSAIDAVLGWVNKLKPAKPYTPQDNENQQQIAKEFPKFLAILDEKKYYTVKN